MNGCRSFQQNLLDYLVCLKHINFCAHTGVREIQNGRRRLRLFDRWTKKQVISIFNQSLEFLTRFTMPFSFDRLENVSNDFLDYHYNFRESNTIPSFPSIVMISFFSRAELNIGLIQQTCPSLRHLHFYIFCLLNDDAIQNTTFTLPTVTELSLNDATYPVDFPILRGVLSLTPNLKHLTAHRDHITVIDTANSDANILGHISKITIAEPKSS